MKNKIVTVFGGSGFVGRYVVKELAKNDFMIKVISRNPDAAIHLKTSGFAGQITLQAGNIESNDAINKAVENSYAVVNLVGIMFEKGGQNFSSVHAKAAERVAKISKAAGVTKLVHMSSLGVERTTHSKYARTKAAGEKAVISAFPEAFILRPSVIFGQEDQFFNQFARMAKYSPFLPLIGGGKTKFQPVYVLDVAKAVCAGILHDDFSGRVFEIGGNSIYSFKDILEYIMKVTGHRRHFINLPFGIAGMVGRLAEILPAPPITSDQVRMLKFDNVLNPDALSLKNLGITPTPVEAVVPQYLSAYR